MRTSKSISTISYNTPKYLEWVLNRLLDNDVITFWCYIQHFAESNETKDHIHLYLEPSNRVDTSTLRKEFEEIDLENSDNKPLSVMPFNSSHFKDWYLYSMHDIDYLRSKGLNRDVYYSRDNFVKSDENYFLEKVNTIDYNYGLTGKLMEAASNDIPFKDLIINGVVKVNNIYQAQKMYDILWCGFHSIKEDEEIKVSTDVQNKVNIQYVQCDMPDDIFNDIE